MLVGFFEFLRKQGVVGLTIGFMIGGAAAKLTTAVVNDLINPLLGLVFNAQNLADKVWTIGQAHVMWGDFLGNVIDFIIIAAVVYFGFKLLRIDRLDLPKE